MPVKYPAAEQEARYGRFAMEPSPGDLVFRLDAKALELRAYLFNIKASGPGQGLRPLRDPDAAQEDEPEEG